MSGDGTPRSCFTCKHLLKQTESWEMPHICWYECMKQPQNGNLKNFPFRTTKCPKWEVDKAGLEWKAHTEMTLREIGWVK